MSKYFECKACKEKFNVNMESSNKGYCHICNEFFMNKQLAELKAENGTLKKENEMLKSNTTRINQNIRDAAKKDYESIKSLEEEITLRNEEIKILSERIKELIVRASKSIETNTHQVCEKIRVESPYCHINGETYFKVYPEILNRIEGDQQCRK